MNTEKIDRRKFSKRLLQLLICGGLTHFSLGNSVYAATSQEEAYKDCPGGMPTADKCDHPKDYDYCPGEKAPADECPTDGNRGCLYVGIGGSGYLRSFTNREI